MVTFTGNDLSSSLYPPKYPWIEIRVLKECGEIYTENGLVTLSKNSQYYLMRTDVEHLINEGYLKHVKILITTIKKITIIYIFDNIIN